jgi:hypothetical protein
MTNEDIIHMAREADLTDGIELQREIEAVVRFAKLVAAAEREACAKLCIEMASWHGDLVTAAYDSAADAIRKRGQG